MPASKYTIKQRYRGEWHSIPSKHLICCCDCGLGHLYEYRIRNGGIQQRGFRHRGLTIAARKARNHKFRKVAYPWKPK